MEMQLKGWPAVIAVVLAIGVVVGYRIHLHRNPEISTQLKERLEFDLMSEISGGIASDAAAAQTAIEQGNTEAAGKIGRDMLSRKVEIDDFDMRGAGDDIIVRAKYTVFGPDEPAQRVGYYRYAYSSVTGWHYQYETTAWSWRMKLF